jgi:HPt (histidine-containing phosphotransfer) domain-containing protein
MATPNGTVPQSMSEALDQMWSRFLSEIGKRLSVLDAAVAALGEGRRSPEIQEAAHQAAHKLAGILGTFGLPDGTELARQAEHLLEKDVPADAVADLAAWVAELRRLVEGRTVRR